MLYMCIGSSNIVTVDCTKPSICNINTRTLITFVNISGRFMIRIKKSPDSLVIGQGCELGIVD